MFAINNIIVLREKSIEHVNNFKWKDITSTFKKIVRNFMKHFKNKSFFIV